MLRAQERPASSAAIGQPAASEPPELQPEPPELRPAPSEVPPAVSAPEAKAPEAQVPQVEAQAPAPQEAEEPVPQEQAPAPQAPPIAARVVGVERERDRPLPSIERALSGPGSRDEGLAPPGQVVSLAARGQASGIRRRWIATGSGCR
jgi:hypothetical protein